MIQPGGNGAKGADIVYLDLFCLVEMAVESIEAASDVVLLDSWHSRETGWMKGKCFKDRG